MFFQKAVNQLEYADVDNLVQSGEPESVVVDYKKSISGSDRHKAELAKDVSAMANSQGGYIIIGVEEKGGKPVYPPLGIERMLGAQKVEEWLDQTLAANTAQRVSVQIRPIEIPSSARCILVIYTPMSPRAPHMVTFQGDNRYYRRYFKRHQFQSLPAEEYEVREMFERSQRFTDRVMMYLQRKGYADPEEGTFGLNKYSQRLGAYFEGTGRIERAGSWAAFVACPSHLQDAAINTSRDEFWQWLEPGFRCYPPDRAIFVPGGKRTTLEGLLCYEEADGFLEGYLVVNGNGYLEYGCPVARCIDRWWYFDFVTMMGLFWRFLGFTLDLYSTEGLLRPYVLMLNMVGTKDSQLANLGKGWVDTSSPSHPYVRRADELNIQIVRELQDPVLSEAQIEELVRYFATKVGNAYGHREPLCYNHPNHDPEARFPVHEITR